MFGKRKLEVKVESIEEKFAKKLNSLADKYLPEKDPTDKSGFDKSDIGVFFLIDPSKSNLEEDEETAKSYEEKNDVINAHFYYWVAGRKAISSGNEEAFIINLKKCIELGPNFPHSRIFSAYLSYSKQLVQIAGELYQ
jgi:hypothetical protein